MGLLKILSDIVTAPGWMVSSAIDEVAHGGIINRATIGLSGNAFRAVADLREAGIDAFAPSGGERDAAWLEVHKRDRKQALHVLRNIGYECW